MAIDMQELYIKAENVCLDLPVRFQSPAKSSMLKFVNPKSKLIKSRVLDGVNLNITPGDRLGLTGKNGAGKTTLLKVLAGIYPATSGEVVSKGNIQSLINIAVGMNPEASGMENIILRGLYMDVPVKQMRSRAEEIIDFAELETSIHKPLYTYSAGMKARLQLSIALSMKPEILLLDEWLGRGDKAFQEKSSKRLEEFVGDAGIVVLASHSEKLLYRMCNRIVYLENGKITSDQKVDAQERFDMTATPSDRMQKAKQMENKAKKILRKARKK